MTIVEFLEARITEDEENARRAAFGWGADWDSVPDNEDEWSFINAEGKKEMVGSEDADVIIHIAWHDPARVLAECAAKRKIMIEHKMVERSDGMKRSIGCELCNFERDYGWNEIGPCQTLRALAAVYKDHPDYCEDWSSAT